MGSDPEKMLHNCLYFTANALARQITGLAEEEFRSLGLSPSHAFVLMLVNQRPGITQKELSQALHLAPSTLTRFVDALQFQRGLVERRSEGKLTRIHPTASGRRMREPIARCWQNLYQRYSEILGEERGQELAKALDLASQDLG